MSYRVHGMSDHLHGMSCHLLKIHSQQIGDVLAVDWTEGYFHFRYHQNGGNSCLTLRMGTITSNTLPRASLVRKTVPRLLLSSSMQESRQLRREVVHQGGPTRIRASANLVMPTHPTPRTDSRRSPQMDGPVRAVIIEHKSPYVENLTLRTEQS